MKHVVGSGSVRGQEGNEMSKRLLELLRPTISEKYDREKG